MAVEPSMIGEVFSSFNLFSLGTEIFAISIALLLARMFTDNKKNFSVAFILLYFCTFLLGWSKQVWLLVVFAFLVGLYRMRGGSDD